jgi:hypothetical protein
VFILNGKKEKYLTTIGQLNFFKWAFKYKIIKYVETNYSKLSAEMFASNKEEKEKKEKKSKFKNKNLQKSKRVVINKKNCTIIAKKVKSKVNDENRIIVSFD